MAIEKGSLALVQCLIDDCQVEVNIPTYSGYTPLHVAAGQGSLDLTCYLVAVGADPSALTDEEDLPLDITPDYDVSFMTASSTSPTAISCITSLLCWTRCIIYIQTA